MEVCLLAKYDQLLRMMNKILEFNCEPEFLRFVINQEECRQKWLSSVEECHRLSKELERSHKDIKEREIKLHHARRLLDQESKLRRKAESERDYLDNQLLKAKELLISNPLNDETRDKLAFLSTTTRPSVGRDPRLDTISEALNSTGSILSDLGYSRSEDDLDESITRGRWKFRRSSPNMKEQTNQNKRRRSDNMNQETPESKPVVLTGKGMMATTSMSVTATGTIRAHSKIEALPPLPKKAKGPSYEPSAPPIHFSPKKSESSTDDSLCQNNHEAATSPNVCGYVFGVNNKKLMSRTHEFVTKTVLRPETCNPCGKKIKFGTVVLKCIDCRASAHPACRNKVPLPCIAVANTPKVKDFNGFISDYTPRDAPMVPSLLIHCINEIEKRGISDVGLYRVPGSDKEVKNLKERFLRGKGIPNLSEVEIHVICSTVKDFLRCLREPLVYPIAHEDFVRAVDGADLETIRSNLYQAITQLPQPNRDTLAYLILHLQRMSQNLECKMNISNLAKIFAITVIGVNDNEQQQALMIQDIQRKIKIMEHLMMIPSEYWNSFVDVEPTPAAFRTPLQPTRSAASMVGENLYLTPLLSNRTPRRGKFFDTPPSAKC